MIHDVHYIHVYLEICKGAEQKIGQNLNIYQKLLKWKLTFNTYSSHLEKNYDRAKSEAFRIQFEQRDKLTIPLFLESETFFLLYRLSGVSENIEDAEHKPEFNLST